MLELDRLLPNQNTRKSANIKIHMNFYLQHVQNLFFKRKEGFHIITSAFKKWKSR